MHTYLSAFYLILYCGVALYLQVTFAVSWTSGASDEDARAVSLLDSEYLVTVIREEVRAKRAVQLVGISAR